MVSNISSTRAVVLSEFGLPVQVAKYSDALVPPLQEGEILVEVEASPINPADLNILEGKYGVLPSLPSVVGVEGVGRVLQVGNGVDPRKIGTRVLLPHGFGCWRQYGVLADRNVRVIPQEVPLLQAAMLRINPATAYCMLHQFTPLQAGNWVVQNAANSGVGRSVIQIAKARGWRTVNVVRRVELTEELLAMGADAVLLEGEDLSKRIREATGGTSPKLGLNAVGGESALGIAGSLEEGATLVTYGAMGRQPLRIPNGFLLFRDLRFRGFWVSRWYQNANPEEVDRLFDDLFAWAAGGVLFTPVEQEYPLSAIHEAIEHAQRSGRAGKILLRPSSNA